MRVLIVSIVSIVVESSSLNRSFFFFFFILLFHVSTPGERVSAATPISYNQALLFCRTVFNFNVPVACILGFKRATQC